ncbi:zinc-binding dehydrogenase [Gracilibacillus halophilus]|uniref:zinc-binding dehydrogenase n=1 Tax=Gracilibacillus halophilus TaxID=470864 RepID=UPI0030840778
MITTSRHQSKLTKATSIGADRVLQTDADWQKELNGEKIDVVIESVGGATFNRSLDVLKKGGRIVTFGSSTNDQITFNLRSFFYGQYHLYGSTMGSREELHSLLDFVNQYRIQPVLDQTFTLDEMEHAWARLQEQEQFGKIAIRLDS